MQIRRLVSKKCITLIINLPSSENYNFKCFNTHHFRFVLYQLSKNLNRPFFMDFLTQLSIRYTEKSAVVDEEDPDDQGLFLKKSFFIYLVFFY